MNGSFAAKSLMLACLLIAGGTIAHAANVTDRRASSAKQLTKAGWLSKTRITEYYPAPEKWFVGAREKATGLDRKSRIDWLYSARGMSMQGDGIGTDGKRYHIVGLGNGGWIAKNGKRAVFGSSDASRSPFWRSAGYWRNNRKAVTFKLEAGGWYNGKGRRYVKPKGITFAEGPSLPLEYYRSVATDRSLIPKGSLVHIGKYRSLNGDGWFRADDTGSAIKGRHLDVYRRPPDESGDARMFPRVRVYVVPKSKIASYVRRESAEDRDGLPLPPANLRK